MIVDHPILRDLKVSEAHHDPRGAWDFETMLFFSSKLAAVDFPMAAGQQVHVTRVHHLHPAEVALISCDFFWFGMDFSNESEGGGMEFPGSSTAQARGIFANFSAKKSLADPKNLTPALTSMRLRFAEQMNQK